MWDLESATCKVPILNTINEGITNNSNNNNLLQMIFRVLTNEEEPPLPAVRPVPSPVTLDYGLEDLQIPSVGPPDHPFFVKGMACSPNGNYLVTAGSGTFSFLLSLFLFSFFIYIYLLNYYFIICS